MRFKPLLRRGEGLSVTFDVPGMGRTAFDWESDLVVAGETIGLDGFRRFDSRYCQSDFESGVYETLHDGDRVPLNLGTGIREVG